MICSSLPSRPQNGCKKRLPVRDAVAAMSNYLRVAVRFRYAAAARPDACYALERTLADGRVVIGPDLSNMC
jgi:hypothetical protein